MTISNIKVFLPIDTYTKELKDMITLHLSMIVPDFIVEVRRDHEIVESEIWIESAFPEQHQFLMEISFGIIEDCKWIAMAGDYAI